MIAILTVQCVVDSPDELTDRIEFLENAGFVVNLDEEIEDEDGEGPNDLI